MLAEVKCSTKQAASEVTLITLRFLDLAFLSQARDAWSKHDSLTLITHHQYCNKAFEERAPYMYGA